MCVCELFPVYSSKQHAGAKLPPELDSLCLPCVLQLCAALGHSACDALHVWLPGAVQEVDKLYTELYATGETKLIGDNMSAEAVKSLDRIVMESGRCHVERLQRCGILRGAGVVGV